MNTDLQLAKLLGAVSLCLGTAQLFAGRAIRDRLGLPVPAAVVNVTGLREIVSGFTVLAHPDEAGPVGVRVAGDALDLAVLGGALLAGNRRTRPAALLATAAVLGITALDVAATAALRRRQSRILATARRTRVRSDAKPMPLPQPRAIANEAASF